MCKIPLTYWAYAYGDLEVKHKGQKNQRLNTLASKMSRASRISKGSKHSESKNPELIKEEFLEYSSGDDSNDSELDMRNYDEFMLKRKMDDIFEEIVGDPEFKEDGKDKN